MRINNEPIAKQILGSKVKRRILAFLLSKQEAVSERELSRIIGVSHTAVNKAMKQLLSLNVVRGKTIGVAIVWELNEKSFAYPYVKALVEASSISPLDYIKKRLKEQLQIANLLIVISKEKQTVENEFSRYPLIKEAYIFGSVAEGTATPESDIDVLIITELNDRTEGLREVLNKSIGSTMLEETGNRISLHFYTELHVLQNKPNWLEKAIEGGIKVF